MNKIKEWLSHLKNPKVSGLLFLAVIVLFGLPLTLFEVSQQQKVQQQASSLGPQFYGNDRCGPNLSLRLDVAWELPTACTTTGHASTASYQSAVTLTPQSGSHGSYSIKWRWVSNWCPNSQTSPCLNVVKSTAITSTDLSGTGGAITLRSETSGPTGGPYANPSCGVYQNDFAFQVFDKTNPSKAICTGIVSFDPKDIDEDKSSTTGLKQGNNEATWCNTSVSCTPVVPTPSPTVKPTPTIEITPSPSPTIIPSPTPTIEITPSPSPTIIPSPTPTIEITPSPGVTVTPTPTDSPGPTAPKIPPVCNSLTADKTTGTSPLSVTFTANGAAPDGTLTKAHFVFGDGQVQDVTNGGGIPGKTANVPVNHIYQAAGNFTASVIFTDSNNNQTPDSSACTISLTVVNPGTPVPPPPSNPTPTPLPPTGPENNIFVTVGLIGAGLILLGGILAFGL